MPSESYLSIPAIHSYSPTLPPIHLSTRPTTHPFSHPPCHTSIFHLPTHLPHIHFPFTYSPATHPFSIYLLTCHTSIFHLPTHPTAHPFSIYPPTLPHIHSAIYPPALPPAHSYSCPPSHHASIYPLIQLLLVYSPFTFIRPPTHRWLGKKIAHRHTHRHTQTQTDRQTDRQTDTQTHRHTHLQIIWMWVAWAFDLLFPIPMLKWCVLWTLGQISDWIELCVALVSLLLLLLLILESYFNT